MVRGKISPMTTQAAGPQVAAKKEIFKQINAIMALTAEVLCLSVFPAVAPMIPTINYIMIMPIAP
jgi:hypothetical protein